LNTLRYWRLYLAYVYRERLPFWIAMHLPARIAYFAFIRVHAASEVHWSFREVAETWEQRYVD
jgi:hypothetical protein